MIQQVSYSLEILVVNNEGKSDSDIISNLANLLISDENLLIDPHTTKKTLEIHIEDKPLGIEINLLKIEKTATPGSYFVGIKSPNFEKLEPFRAKVINLICNEYGTSNVSIITDTISERISQNVYMLIKEAENTLRKSINKSFIMSIGPEWLASVSSNDMVLKIARKIDIGNSRFFALDPAISVTDFDDLLVLVHKWGLDDPLFFEKWDLLTKYRNRVFTYMPFVVDDYTLVQKTVKDVKADIQTYAEGFVEKYFEDTEKARLKAELKLSEVATVVEEKPLVEQAVPTTILESYTFVPIEQEISPNSETPNTSNTLLTESKPSEEEVQNTVQYFEELAKGKVDGKPDNDYLPKNVFMEELRLYQAELNGQPVSLKTFALKILGAKGYTSGAVYALSRELSDNGMVLLYEAKDAEGDMCRAVKTIV
jgi:hypothetical protein